MSAKNSTLVYSSETGSLCPGCGKALKGCTCRQAAAAPPNDGVVRIMRQTKGRKGKGVCLITGLPLKQDELEKLAKQLKQRCGAGGAVKDGVVEIQGDHRDTLKDELAKLGYKVKLAGG